MITKMMGASLAASVAIALAGCGNKEEAKTPDGSAGTTTTTSGKVQCKEANSCKGNASCAGTAKGEKHSCKGSNSCAGNVREITKAECDAIKGTVAGG